MRIDAYNQMSQVYSVNRSARAARSAYAQAVSQPADNIEISQLGKDYQTARRAVAAAPDVRAEVVASARQKLSSGKYDSITGASFAERLMDKAEAAQAIA